ncbi:glutamyl-tRNA synthetase-like protein [Apodospora peruviana]|uniref:Glutamate--tRNA ligase, mitochondrial n=1 Tax=Apodospora peruviana TaxID=516989 RepID=A0AAE0ICJ0_9PEZI|nr:glutamyl-tRNA synthetase-like protein [Apodospora peruviana]
MSVITVLRRPVCPKCTRIRSLSVTRLWFSSSSTVDEKFELGPATTKFRNPFEKLRLPNTPCRTRFAPSPTGYLHLGSLRTALFNYLLARATGGQFILRIEDTDQSRLVPDAEERLYEDLKWAGLKWDEGPDVSSLPYRQSQRLVLYNNFAKQLIDEGKAYKCFCSVEELELAQRTAQQRGGHHGHSCSCRFHSSESLQKRAEAGQPFTVRFKSSETPVVVQDIVYGRYCRNVRDDDFIIMKQDGFPTYHFANVIDDKFMKITHVIRGAEWLVSTPKHVDLYNAFGWTPPAFAHLGLLVNMNRQKMSKRDGDISISWYRERGYLPSALLNFVAMLGWNRGNVRSDVMTLHDMINQFTLNFSKGDSAVSFEKLPFLQRKHQQLLFQQKAYEAQWSFVNPITDIIESTETTRLLSRRTEPSQSYTGPDPLLLDSLGAGIREGYRENGKGSLQTHILTLLRLTILRANNSNSASISISDPSKTHATCQDFVTQHKYLFWGIPKHVLESTFVCDMLSRSVNQAQVPAIRHAKFWENLHRAVIRETVAALRSLLSLLSELDAQDWGEEHPWTLDRLQPIVKTLGSSETAPAAPPNEDGSGFRVGIFKVYRWALTALDHGPSIGNVMNILGKEETLLRLRNALEIAEKYEMMPKVKTNHRNRLASNSRIVSEDATTRF